MDDLTRFRLRNVLSCILEGVVRRGDMVRFSLVCKEKNSAQQPVTRFTALSAPNISIRDYMERFVIIL